MRMLVTAGPTREFIDPVRFLSNRSSGKMGYAVAVAARDRGHEVVLVSGPVALPAPYGIEHVAVVSAADMLAAVQARVEWCDVLIMAAAVADWRPVAVADQKIKKIGRMPELRIEPTPDILRAVRDRKGTRTFVGFAAETETLLDEGRRKLRDKGLDAIMANDVSRADAGFDVDTNRVTFLTSDGAESEWPLMAKTEVADRLMAWIEARRGLTPAAATRAFPGAGGLRAGDRLARQIDFIREIDKLKTVLRRTMLMDGSRYENDAEHSWHLAIMAVLLKEHANAVNVDIDRVIRLALAHDLVEIDAGDTYCYDDAGQVDRVARERRAADRIFALLPQDQEAEMRALWDEFEARETPEARFAAALDRIQPLLHNYATGGQVWKKHGVNSAKVRERNRHVADGSRALWEYAESLIDDAVRRGFLAP
jgi:putative hydrolase of HD superfamily